MRLMLLECASRRRRSTRRSASSRCREGAAGAADRADDVKPEARLQRDVIEMARRFNYMAAHFRAAQVREGVGDAGRRGRRWLP